jgi:CheY-like chemotaxis protein
MEIKIFAVDDNEKYLDTIDRLFASANGSNKFKLVGSSSAVETKEDVDDLLETIEYVQPDIVLMDIDFSLANRPSDFGIELIQQITDMEKDGPIKIIVLSSPSDNDKEEVKKLRRSFKAGAVAYLSKNDMKDWATCITETHKSVFKRNNADHVLSNREKEVLLHLANDCTGNMVHEQMEGIGNPGVQFHINNLRAKFGVTTLHGIVSTAFRIKALT